MSIVTPESEDAIDRYFRAKRMREGFGTSLHGPNLTRWPARTVDAFDVIEIESIRHDNARMDAETNRNNDTEE